uniref:Uncharacterized protein n=1 Tax=Avena sativa TaxID=4498 RepID=A0ACD5TI32_AVESA
MEHTENLYNVDFLLSVSPIFISACEYTYFPSFLHVIFSINVVAGRLIFCITFSCTRDLNTQAGHIDSHCQPIVTVLLNLFSLQSGILCILVDALIQLEIYSNYVQAHLAPSGYLKIPTDMADYLDGCKFLPKLNNEIPDERNATYKERFSSLENLVLIMFEDDAVLIPRETAWFGYYPDGAFNPVLPPQETKLYTEDWIGLRTLDVAGRVKFVSVPGGHLRISRSDMKKYIVPYLTPCGPSKQSVRQILSI